MAVIGVAGLPGSGKSTLMYELQRLGCSRYNDINRDWNSNLPKARSEAQRGRNVAVSDIMFCNESWRGRLQRELGVTCAMDLHGERPVAVRQELYL